ncbi:MAG TPA: class I SAM-dependent methyltransferase [Gaiellaceae bacterium]|jgi:ubiquinone/menaquinone biosynthesis C-methylase UbiE
MTHRPELARSFGSAVDDYVRGRPGWPEEAIAAPGIPRDALVVDLAAGTGKLTEQLERRFDRVIAIEPDPVMRAANGGADVRAGSAEAIPLEAASVDAVFVAEAFHWFCDPPALRELERVLRPGGTLVVLWNRPRRKGQLPRGVDAVMQRLREQSGLDAKTHRFYSGTWRDVFPGSRFGPIEEAMFEHEHVLSADELVSYLMSQSAAASRPADERAAIRAELTALIPPGRHVRPLRAETYWTTLQP